MTRVCLGKIVEAHGIKGLVKILPFGEDVTLLGKLPLYKHAQGDETITLTLKNPQGQYILAAIPMMEDRTAAEKLRGTELWVEKAALPEIEEEDTYYHVDLIGLKITGENGDDIGTLKNVLNYGSTDLFEIRLHAGGSVIIPFTEQYVAKIDMKKAVVTVRSIEDFMNL